MQFNSNAKFNNITNVNFYCEDSTKFINELAKTREKIDTVVMDPPRTGSTEQFIMSCVKLNPKKIIYVSCGPDTLARDLKLFYKNNYTIEKGSCFDMFCFSEHIETVVLLTKTFVKGKK